MLLVKKCQKAPNFITFMNCDFSLDHVVDFTRSIYRLRFAYVQFTWIP